MTRDTPSLTEQFDRAIARIEGGEIVIAELLALLAHARTAVDELGSGEVRV